jgi:hypothetical protein
VVLDLSELMENMEMYLSADFSLITLSGRKAQFVHCNQCGYDSGDKDSLEDLKKKVTQDGGSWDQTKDGADIHCPNGHTDITLD